MDGCWTLWIFECILMSRICTFIHTIANLSQPSLFWYLTICIVYSAVRYDRYVSHIWSWVTLEVQHDTHTTLEMHTLMACLQKYLLTGTSSYLRPRWTWRWLTSEESNWFPPINSKTQKMSLHHYIAMLSMHQILVFWVLTDIIRWESQWWDELWSTQIL